MKNCFQNMNYFSWIKLTPVLIHLKYRYYNTPSQELPCLPHNLFNTIVNMFFIRFPIMSFSIWPHATSTGYTKPYIKPSNSNFLSSYIQIIKTYGSSTLPIKKLSLWEPFPFKVSQHGKQQLNLQCKMCWILYKMIRSP